MTTINGEALKVRIITMVAIGGFSVAATGAALAGDGRSNTTTRLPLIGNIVRPIIVSQPSQVSRATHGLNQNIIHSVTAKDSGFKRSQVHNGGALANAGAKTNEMAPPVTAAAAKNIKTSETTAVTTIPLVTTNPPATSAAANGPKSALLAATANILAVQDDPNVYRPRKYGDPCKAPQATERPVGCPSGTPSESMLGIAAKNSWHVFIKGSGTVTTAISSAAQKVGDAAEWFYKGNVRAFEIWPEFAKTIGNGAINAAKAIGNGVESAAKSVGGAVGSAAKSAGNAVESAASSVANAIGSLF